jgi:hypothetical protein
VAFYIYIQYNFDRFGGSFFSDLSAISDFYVVRVIHISVVVDLHYYVSTALWIPSTFRLNLDLDFWNTRGEEEKGGRGRGTARQHTQ